MSYSHPATQQDLWVLENSNGPGTFIELGAYDGLRHSNTLLLEENGWTGTLVEGHGPFFRCCERNRPNTRVVYGFVGNGDIVSVVVGGQYTGIERMMPEEFLREHILRDNPVYEAHTLPLHRMVGSGYVSYLSLDTEGGEYEILKDWFGAGGSCRLLTVEFRYDNAMLHRLERLCDEHGMDLVEIRGFDACFAMR